MAGARRHRSRASAAFAAVFTVQMMLFTCDAMRREADGIAARSSGGSGEHLSAPLPPKAVAAFVLAGGGGREGEAPTVWPSSLKAGRQLPLKPPLFASSPLGEGRRTGQDLDSHLERVRHRWQRRLQPDDEPPRRPRARRWSASPGTAAFTGSSEISAALAAELNAQLLEFQEGLKDLQTNNDQKAKDDGSAKGVDKSAGDDPDKKRQKAEERVPMGTAVRHSAGDYEFMNDDEAGKEERPTPARPSTSGDKPKDVVKAKKGAESKNDKQLKTVRLSTSDDKPKKDDIKAKKDGAVKNGEEPKAARPSTRDDKPKKDDVKAKKDDNDRRDKQPEATRRFTADDGPRKDSVAKEDRKATEAKESKGRDEGAKAAKSKTRTEGVLRALSDLSTLFANDLRQIAHGTSSTVYAGHSPSLELGKEVAVKSMKPQHTSDVQWIQNEISFNALLTGRPGFVKMYRATPLEYVKVGQDCLIEMELCAGSLDDFIVKGDINMGWMFLAPFDVRIRFFYEISRAVAELAKEGIIHRDLKPANVLIRGDPQRLQECTAVLADFGSACSKERNFPCPPLDGSRLGSPAFIAPEAWGPEGKDTPARDVWSLGIILFRLITGRYPYLWYLSQDLDHNIQMLQDSFELRRDPFFRMIKEQEPTIARLLTKMLDVDPEDRISAEEVVKALEKYALESDIDLKPSLPLPRWRSLMRKLHPGGLGRRRKDARSGMFK